MTIKCDLCNATIYAKDEQIALAQHKFQAHGVMTAGVEILPMKGSEKVEPQPGVVKSAVAATPNPMAEMIEMMIGQLEGAMSVANAPAFVVKPFGEFIAALKEWAAGRTE